MPTSREIGPRPFHHSEGFTAREVADSHKPPSGYDFDTILGTGEPSIRISKTAVPARLLNECQTQEERERLFEMWYGPGTVAAMRASREVEGC